ncbi:hypothetical protein ACFLUG_03310 [Chloroflexota bacterium]
MNRKYFLFLLLLPVIFLGLLSACTGNGQDIISGTGTIEFIDLEGGFYGIMEDGGDRYDPVNLAEEYREDGLRIRFEAEIRDDLESFHQWAQLVEIVEIEIIK